MHYCVCLFSFFIQKDDMDGEIDLKSCVKVSEFDVEKNYGFQIQVNLSASGQTDFLPLFIPLCLC